MSGRDRASPSGWACLARACACWACLARACLARALRLLGLSRSGLPRSGLPPLLPREVRLVALRELGPLVRELVLGEARVDGAGLDARVAVDALLGVDVELLDLVVVGLIRRRVDAVDRADLDARVVLGADAGLCDDVGHISSLGVGEQRGASPAF